MLSLKLIIEGMKQKENEKNKENKIQEFSFINELNKTIEKLEETETITIPLKETHWLFNKKIKEIKIIKINENLLNIVINDEIKQFKLDDFNEILENSANFAVKSLKLTEVVENFDKDSLLIEFIIGLIGNLSYKDHINEEIKQHIILKTNKFLSESDGLAQSPFQFIRELAKSHPWFGKLLNVHGLHNGATALLALNDNSELEIIVKPAKYGDFHHDYRSGK